MLLADVAAAADAVAVRCTGDAAAAFWSAVDILAAFFIAAEDVGLVAAEDEATVVASVVASAVPAVPASVAAFMGVAGEEGPSLSGESSASSLQQLVEKIFVDSSKCLNSSKVWRSLP